MVHVKLTKQSPEFCGPACGVMAVGYYGMDIEEANIARIMKANRDTGVEAPEMVQCFHRLGFRRSFYRDNCSVEDLKRLAERFPVIVDWTPKGFEDGHYCCVERVGKNKIVLADPYLFDTRREDLDEFIKNWKDFPGLIPDPSIYYYRRAIVVRP